MKKILIIEDDPAISMGLEAALTFENYEVIKENDGLKGYESALQKNPDLVLLDVILPSMNGFQICSKLKNEGCIFPIFMLTSMDKSEHKLNGLSRGADDYIPKPFNMQELLLKIRNVLNRTSILNDRAAKLEEDLKKIKEKVQASDELKSEFLSITTHEVRTPINAILGNLYLLKEELEDKLSEEQSSSFDIVDHESRRLIRTVDSMILLSELQQETYKKEITVINLKELLDELMPEFRKEASHKNLVFQFNHEPTEITIQADRYSTSQLFAHLISNAVKFTEKGSVEIVLFTNQENKPFVQLKDAGIGITETFTPKLFEPFRQENSGYTKNYEGNGIGLTLVKKCCELNNADISVQSTKHKGSTFTIVFN
ncbi:MAG: response regulator [Bacteroidetes bacterium]|nr:response regulator [Bacteroidota bacterium]